MTGPATIIFSGRAWLAPALAALAAVAVALVWAARRSSAKRWVPMVCGGLKLAGVTALALCLLEPLWVSQRARPGANVFALIADNSQSLQIKDEGETASRGEILRRQLVDDPQGWQPALEENFQLRRYTFDSRLQSTRDFSELNFDGRASALGEALRTAMEHWRGQPVAGVLLFTDGNATDLPGDLPSLEGCPPIYPVVLGKETGLRDISVDKVTVSQTAFEDAPVTVQARVSAQGFAGSEIKAELTEVAAGAMSAETNAAAPAAGFSLKSNIVATLSQRSTEDNGELNFRFQIQPDKPGIHFYELQARSSEELKNQAAPSREATLANNRQMIVVDRGQEPYRVLYVGGRPDWEYKFLNRAILDDPQVQMVALMRIARREPKFEFKGRAGESSNPLFRGNDQTDEDTARYDQPVILRLNAKDEFELRGGFPKTAEELFKYHAVILDHVEADFFTHDQMVLMQRFVSERGGGFLMLGGVESFREGNYTGTAVASMLPVYLDRPVDVKLPASLRLTLNREGWLQPWTRLYATEAEEQKRLEAMPEFLVVNPVREIKPGASLLATVSDANNRSYPALVVQRFGLGRTAALMIGDLWRWGMQDETMQKDLAKSWRQMVRWLVSDVPARVTVAAETTADPTLVRLMVKARDEEFKPLDGSVAKLTIRPVRLFPPETGQPSNASAATNFVELTAEPSATEPGTYEATYVARNAGAYAVDALVTQADGKVVGRSAAGWTSDPAVDEFRSLKPNRALLETIARRTGGEIVAMENLRSFVQKLPERRAPVTETTTAPLWHKPVVFLFVLGCFLSEWGLRRWKGLP